MKNLKKVLALVVAFSMMLSVVAFASYNDVDSDADYAAAVELLSALNIIKGDDLGNFNPDNTITRAEFAAVVCRAKGLENSANGAAGATAFTDVAADHWASGYINLATQNGIINGYGDGTFGPEDKVTYEQAVKMLVCALGFEPMAANKGGYPTGYLVVANQYKITAGVKATAEAPRKTVAQLVYNALSTPLMDQTSYGTDAAWEVLDGKNDRDYATLLTEMDIYIATGTVGSKVQGEDKVEFAVKETSDDFEFGLYSDGVSKKDGYANIIYDGDSIELIINGSNILDYKNQYVDVYVEKDNKDYKVMAVVPSTMGESLTINSDDIDYDNCEKNVIEYFVDSKNTKSIKLDDDVKIEYNEKVVDDSYTVKTAKELLDDLGLVDNGKYVDDADMEITFIENDGNNKYDILVFVNYESERVESVEADRDRLELQSGTIKFDFDDEDIQYVLVDDKGNALELSDFAEDDVVAYITDNNNKLKDFDYIKIVKLSNSAVTGTVSEISTDEKTVWIDKVEYDVAASMVGEIQNEDEGTFFIGMTGKIIDFDGSAASKEYAYILEAGLSTSTFSDAWEIKLLTQKDGVVTYTLTDDASDDFEADYKAKLDIKGTQMLFADGDLGNEYRFVTYKTNSAGKIKTIEKADGTLSAIDAGADYRVATQKIDGKTLEDDVVIYNVAGSKVDSVYTTDINSLVDEGEYQGYIFKDAKKGENVAMIVTEDAGQLSDETGFAIVTSVRKGKIDGENIVTVEYVQDEEEGTVIFNDDSEINKKTKEVNPEALQVGDIFMFTANAEGIVNRYAVLAQIDGKGLLNVYEDTLKAFSEDNEFYYGYIANTKKDSKSKGENITLVCHLDKGDKLAELTVANSSNRYTYNDANSRNIAIETDDFMGSTNTDYYDADKDEATMVFVRVVDDDVVDIYSFDERVKASTAAGLYVDCGKAKPQAAKEITPVEAEEEIVVKEEDIEVVDID